MELDFTPFRADTGTLSGMGFLFSFVSQIFFLLIFQAEEIPCDAFHPLQKMTPFWLWLWRPHSQTAISVPVMRGGGSGGESGGVEE